VFLRTAARKRGLTEADRALWQAYTARAAVRPLPGRAAAPARRRPAPAAVAPPAAACAGAGPPRASAAPRPPAELPRRRRAGRAGRAALARPAARPHPPERVLDLHGRRAHEAHGALRQLPGGAHADGVRCVAVVTGKGSTPEGGVLRRELPHWLNAPDLRPLLLGAAHPHAANPGAVHLLLRRRRG
jgi:DNA-nicking Smr family endonuclease